MKRFQGDQCLRMAASLSYTSLLAAVPLTAIAFAMLAAFPVFEGVRNTTTLSAVGIVALALTAVLLLGVSFSLSAYFFAAT